MPDVWIADQLLCFLLGDQSAEFEALLHSRNQVIFIRHQRDPMSPSPQPGAQAHERENVTVSANRYEDCMHGGQASEDSFRSRFAVLWNRPPRPIPQHAGQTSVIRPAARTFVTR